MQTLSLDRWAVRVMIPETNDGCSQTAYVGDCEAAVEMRDRARDAFLDRLKGRTDIVNGSIEVASCRTHGGWVRILVRYQLKNCRFLSCAEFESLYEPLESRVLSAGDDPGFVL